MEKIMSDPCTVTIPPLKTCTTGARLEPLQIPLIEDDPAAGVLREGAVCDNMSQIIAQGTTSVWTVVGNVAEVVAKRTIVVSAMVLGVTRGMLVAVGILILWTVKTKMPCEVAVKTMSLISHLGFWAQMGISRCNVSGVRSGSALMESRMRVSRVV